MKAKVNDECIGCGMCVNVCPQVFELNSAGLSVASGDVTGVERQTREAAELCPVNAIEVWD